MADPTLLTISGSLRQNSFNRMLLSEAVNAFGPARVVEADIDLPLYHGDLEETHGVPEKVKKLAEQIRSADALVISAPEYNKGISGALKNALDWVSRVDFGAFKDKPVVLMSAAAGRTGGETGLFMTQSCLAQFQVRFILGAPVMIAAAHEQFDENGKLREQSYRDALTARMSDLRTELQ
ncbi:MAG: NADPH-dependent FMN reductase [Pseudomonadota bacterium]